MNTSHTVRRYLCLPALAVAGALLLSGTAAFAADSSKGARPQQAAPRAAQAAPRAAQAAPRAAPRAAQAAPRAAQGAPRAAQAAPRAAQAAPRASQAAPRASQAAPRASQTTPRAAQGTPRPQTAPQGTRPPANRPPANAGLPNNRPPAYRPPNSRPQTVGPQANRPGYRPPAYRPPAPRYVPRLPSGYVRHYWNGSPYYYAGGYWYRPWGTSFQIVTAPYGLFVSTLPPYYSTFWYGTSRYYFADSTYYLYDDIRRGYVVAQSPYGDEELPADAAMDEQLYVYPAQGQSEQQTADDRYECHRWAVDQSGFDPVESDYNAASREEYQRAERACLIGRGYTVQ